MSTARQLSPDAVIEAAKLLTETELDNLIRSLHAVQAQRKSRVLDADETMLLDKINNGPPVEVRQRYRQLIKKRRQGKLSEDEHAELLRLTEVAEQYQVERLAALIRLARIRNVSLDQLMHSLGITPPPVE
ncbi:MAG: STAS/SEC14 domain-containing protein [Chloroflexia bacterium]